MSQRNLNFNFYSKKFLEVSSLGAVCGLASLPLEHPLDTVKTTWQADPSKYKNTLQVASSIYNKYGIRGFYAGILPNATRMAIKQSYRWPLMIALPDFYSKVLHLKHNTSVNKIVTGGTIACLETFVVCPLERLKVYIMTSPHHQVSKLFSSHTQSYLMTELFRGLNATFVRQMVSWISFFWVQMICIKSS